MRIKGIIPDHIIKRMSREDRPAGKAGMTTEELQAKAVVRLERELHNLCLSLCRQRGIAVGHARMDRKSTYTEGWPDLSMCINGQAVFVELKLPGRDLDPEQVKIRHALLDIPNHGRYYVCRSLESFRKVLDYCMLPHQGLAEQLAENSLFELDTLHRD